MEITPKKHKPPKKLVVLGVFFPKKKTVFSNPLLTHFIY